MISTKIVSTNFREKFCKFSFIVFNKISIMNKSFDNILNLFHYFGRKTSEFGDMQIISDIRGLNKCSTMNVKQNWRIRRVFRAVNIYCQTTFRKDTIRFIFLDVFLRLKISLAINIIFCNLVRLLRLKSFESRRELVLEHHLLQLASRALIFFFKN